MTRVSHKTDSQKSMPLPDDFCQMHLHYVLACSDKQIDAALDSVPKYDLDRLRRIVEGK